MIKRSLQKLKKIMLIRLSNKLLNEFNLKIGTEKFLYIYKLKKEKKQLLREKEAKKILTKFIMEKNERNRLKKLKGDKELVLL